MLRFPLSKSSKTEAAADAPAPKASAKSHEPHPLDALTGAYLQRAAVMKVFNRVTGGAFIGFAGLMVVLKR